MPELLVVQGPPTRELLASLLAEPIGALVLVDHRLLGACPPAPGLHSADAVRTEAQWATLTLELARHAVRTVVLAHGRVEDWRAVLVGMLRDLLIAPLSEWSGHGSEWPSVGDTPATRPVTPLLSPYLEPLFAAAEHPTQPLELIWPRESFLWGDAPGEALPATVEVAGRARILAYGPYLPLPSGRWRATAFLGFSPDIGKLPFILEVDNGGAVVRGLFDVERGGIFTVTLDFHVADPLQPIELRLISQDSALEGQLALIEAALQEAASPLGG
jgi:hypothetical protein